MSDTKDLFSDPRPNNNASETNPVNNRNSQQSFPKNNANADSNEYEHDNDNDNDNDNEDKLSNNKPQTLLSSTQSSIVSATVKRAFVKDNIVFYEIQVKSDNSLWNITKRYSQFEELHNSLIDKRKLVLPAKHNKMFTDHLSPAFIEQRRALLDNYVKKLLKKNTSQPLILKFLNEDKNPNAQNDTANNNSSDNNNNNTDKEGLEFPEDQEVTGISIPTIRKMIDHVLYQIEVTNDKQRKSFSTWTVLKRFGNFYDMDIKLRQGLNTKTDVIEKLPPAPPRRAKLVYDHMDDNFIEERRVLLENYLNKLIQFPEVAKNENFLEFLGVNTI